MLLSEMHSIKILWFFIFILPLEKSSALPFESMKLKPLLMIAPVSHIQVYNRGDWRNTIDPDPHSYIIRRSSAIETEPVNDQMTLPSLVSFMVKHPMPKSLEISYAPQLEDSLSSLKISDSIFDAVQNIASNLQNRNTTLTTRRPRPSKPTLTTRRPRPSIRPRPTKPRPTLKTKQIPDEGIQDEITTTMEVISSPPSTTPHPLRPQNNNLAGQSQIGNRESQMVIKPTVIVNIRGTVSNTDSDIKVESRSDEDSNSTMAVIPPSVFHINQEVNIENTFSMADETDDPSTSIKRKTIVKPQGKSIKDDEDDEDDKEPEEKEAEEQLAKYDLIYEVKIIETPHNIHSGRFSGIFNSKASIPM